MNTDFYRRKPRERREPRMTTNEEDAETRIARIPLTADDTAGRSCKNFQPRMEANELSEEERQEPVILLTTEPKVGLPTTESKLDLPTRILNRRKPREQRAVLIESAKTCWQRSFGGYIRYMSKPDATSQRLTLTGAVNK